MNNKCCVCNNDILNSRVRNVCDDCLNKSIIRYKEIMSKFYDYLNPKSEFYAQTHSGLGIFFNALFEDSSEGLVKENKLKEFNNRINNMDFWYKMINSSDKFILDKDFILGTWNKKFDTFSFVKEFIDDINFENLIDEWNKFITATEPLPMGEKYCWMW